MGTQPGSYLMDEHEVKIHQHSTREAHQWIWQRSIGQLYRRSSKHCHNAVMACGSAVAFEPRDAE